MITHTSDIDELIKKHNPFAGHFIVKSQQIWGKSFPDVPSINAHASNAVFDAVEKIRQGQRTTVGITITAEKGLGKSHIISRVRHRLQTEGDSLFIYMNKYDNLNQIKYEFLQNVASSLRAFGNQDVMQWQEIAAALINEVKQWDYTPQKYITQYPTWLRKFSHKFVEQLAKLVHSLIPELTNPYIIQAILWTLSPVHVNYANCWLAGLEITPEDARVMGLPNLNKEDRETESLRNVRQIINITSRYKIPVFCFDELDNADVADNGLTTAQVIGSLVKDLYNNLNKGIFLLTMYPETWNDQIRFLPQAEAAIDRLVSENANRQPIDLKYLNADDIIALTQKWLQNFYQQYQINPPHSLYPFDETKLRSMGRDKPTSRVVLNWCAENFVPIGDSKKNSPVQEYFDNELANVEASITSLIHKEVEIADALRLAFKSLIGKILEGIKIELISEIEPSAANNGFMDFKIIGNNGTVRIGLDVVQQDRHVISAALGRLIDYKRFNITRGCLVRSKTISTNAVLARNHLRKLLQEQGGEWVSLQSQDIKPLLAILFVYYNRESYELTEEEIFDFIEQRQLAINNPLIREILSDPSGQEPTNLTDDGLPLSIPQSVATADNVELAL
ncbi:hypothetical protein H6G33_28820 [Calothrix sp. FACHB-1219]|uniref:hypothetical protein n=1 Tax=unclassified Calothrix TaxID=2619626 RepID=UPI0016848CBA|nr:MULTISPECIES: hypothetical protein [unclassified Calothrix]MBD2204169.1 hypothetical protein [Calothrix sp. FACHB-168]MBD2220983.1 hypothetical protein [Calothrix sp. FACHB-1219]